jgi:hypothetical protein
MEINCWLQDIAEEFNEQFANVGEEIRKNK